MKDPIVQSGEAILRELAKPVSKKDIASRKVKNLIAAMKHALKNEGFGVALAAPQVGISLRIFVVAGKAFMPEDAPEDAPLPPEKVFINPECIRRSKVKTEMTEGCLSVRNKYGSVMRHERVSVRALDERGEPFVYHASGLVAQIFQHEVDHLDGILYTDKAVTLRDDKDWQVLREKRNKKE